MSIQKLLEYQKIDMQYRKLNAEIRNSDAAKKKALSAAQLKQATEDFTRCSVVLETENANYEKLAEQFRAVAKEVEEIGESTQNENDDQQLEYYAKQLSKKAAQLESLEKECARILKELGATSEQAKKTFALGKELQKRVKIYTEEYNKLIADRKKDAEELHKQRAAAEKEVDPRLMEMYKKAQENGKAPYFVPLAGESCGGCGMGLDVAVMDRFKAGQEIDECPNCGRYIYKK